MAADSHLNLDVRVQYLRSYRLGCGTSALGSAPAVQRNLI